MSALVADAVAAAWHRSWCRACGGPTELGEPVGFVRGVGPCCPRCLSVSAALAWRIASRLDVAA